MSHINNKCWDKKRFNEIYADPTFDGGVHHLEVGRSTHYPLFKVVVGELLRLRSKSVLEIGCGAGGLAQLIHERTRCKYQGIDFSEQAVELAIHRTGRSDCFKVADAREAKTYSNSDYDTIVCLEVLEHIDEDFKVIEHWRPGLFCVLSLPDFGCDGHVRWFPEKKKMAARYEKYLEFDRISRIEKPPFPDISLLYRLKSIRWAGYTMSSIRKAFGLYPDDQKIHWYCASSVRKQES